MQILEEQQIGDLLSLRHRIDAGTHLPMPLGAAVEGRSIHLVPGCTQALRNVLPDPTALIGAMQQNEGRHVRRLPDLATIPRFAPMSTAMADFGRGNTGGDT